jgi:hypothetical protein
MQQPLAWFLAEIWTAWTAPCSRFDWGHARSLPFLPRVRRGRSILHPARWLIGQATFPARTATWPQWRDAWQRYRARNRLPREVLLGDDDVRIRLDLDEPAHLAVLRSHLDRQGHAVLTEAPGPTGWLDGRPAELLLTLTGTQPRHSPRATRPASTVHHRPGASPWLNAHLYGRCDDILTRLFERQSDLPEGWWFLRYSDPAPHVRLRIPLHTIAFTDAARDLAEWAEQLRTDGILSDYALHTYRPETRHGTGPTLAAAEAVFAADSAAALQRLSGDRQAATAAGMIAIAEAFTGGNGLRWLAEHVPRRSGPRLKAAQLALARAPYGGDDLSAALVTYRSLADRDGLDTDQVLAGGRPPPHRSTPPAAALRRVRPDPGADRTRRRSTPHRDLDLLKDVLTYLVRLTEPVGGLPGWWCPTGPNYEQPPPVGGHSNHGIAHGITGPLALLSLAMSDGVTVDGHTEAITRICQWLDTWEQRTGSGAWWPQIITLDDIRRGEPSQPGPLRPSWCYGTPGIARAQQLAACALGDTTRQHNAETAFTGCIHDPAQTTRLIDRSLCHGTAGLLAAGHRIAADALIPIPLTPLRHLHQHATAAAAGEPAGFLDGSAGAALATVGTSTTSWDACLLLS